MSSFKKLSKADITTVPYAANKQWVLPFTCPSISNDYFNIYKGTYITGTFSPNNYATDPFTNNQYERLIYDSINHLFYQKYSGSLDTSSLMFNLNTYQSASQDRPTGSYFNYNINPNLVKNFPTGVGDGIRVLAINQDIYGSKILPYSFNLSSSLYYMTDDGNGNIYSGSTHIGNIFYSHGLAVITNPDYQLMFPLPPIANNDTATFLTSDTGSKIIDILANDISRSCALDTGSVILSGSNLTYYTTNSNGTITLNYSSSGNYDVYYTVNSKCNNGCSLTSNKAKVTVNVIAVASCDCYTYNLFYDAVSSSIACTYIDPTMYYSCCSPLTTSCALYTLSDCTGTAADGYYSDGNTVYTVGGGIITSFSSCSITPPSSSYNAQIYARIGDTLSGSYSTEIYYAIGTGSSVYFDLLDSSSISCSYKGTINVPTGSTLSIWTINTYPVVYYTSYNAATSSICPTNLDIYCGSSPFIVTVNSNMDISLTGYISSSGNFKVCT